MMKETEKNSMDYYMEEVNRIPLLTPEEERKVAEKAFNGDRKAVEKLVRANLRFVITVAKSFQGRGVALEDLIAEGNEGLIIAAEKFDPEKNTKFITYAVWWIRLSMRKVIYRCGRDVYIPVGKTEELLSPKWNMKSLEETLDENGDTVFGDLIGDMKSLRPDDRFLEDELGHDLERSLGVLSPLEKNIVCRRFGLDCKAQSLQDIGSSMGFSKERVRQIQIRAMKKMYDVMAEYGYAA